MDILNFSHLIDIYYCEELLVEVRKLSKMDYFISKGITAEIIEDFIALFEIRAVKVPLNLNHENGRDLKYNYLINLCKDANLDYLITAEEN